jgi:hypothetical protein
MALSCEICKIRCQQNEISHLNLREIEEDRVQACLIKK